MDEKTYKFWLAKIAEGEMVSQKTFEALIEFYKAKKATEAAISAPAK